MATPSTPMVKVSLLHNRDQSRGEETWQKWCKEELMPRVMPFALKHGIDRVEVYFTPNSFKKQLEKDHLEHLKSNSSTDWNIAPYDAAAIYWANDFQNVRDMFNDPEWEGIITKFVEGWIDTTKMDVQVGTQTTFIEDGKVVKNVPTDFIFFIDMIGTFVVGCDMADATSVLESLR